jgi:hypothetical protein
VGLANVAEARMPQRIPGSRIECHKIPTFVSGEDDASSRTSSPPRLHRKACVATDLACLVIDGRENSQASRTEEFKFWGLVAAS